MSYINVSSIPLVSIMAYHNRPFIVIRISENNLAFMWFSSSSNDWSVHQIAQELRFLEKLNLYLHVTHLLPFVLERKKLGGRQEKKSKIERKKMWMFLCSEYSLFLYLFTAVWQEILTESDGSRILKLEKSEQMSPS